MSTKELEEFGLEAPADLRTELLQERMRYDKKKCSRRPEEMQTSLTEAQRNAYID